MKYFKKSALLSPLVKDSIGMRDSKYNVKSVFIIEKFGDHINFVEGCTHYFSKMMTKKEAVEALKEAIKWIENDE